MSNKQMSMCYPYGMGVSCICDARGRIYKCFPSLDALQASDHGGGVNGAGGDLAGEAMLSRDDRAGDAGMMGDDLGFDLDGGGLRRRRGLDERTEIILAATFLVLIILAFIR